MFLYENFCGYLPDLSAIFAFCNVFNLYMDSFFTVFLIFDFLTIYLNNSFGVISLFF